MDQQTIVAQSYGGNPAQNDQRFFVPAQIMSRTMRANRIRLARLAVTAMIVGTGLAVASSPASADSFLEGKSNGMRKCVNAILGGYAVKGVNVHGHHFNCKPMSRFSSGFRQIVLSHDQFGRDDQYLVNFYVDSLNVLVSDSLKVSTIEGVSLETLKSKAIYLHTLSLINRALLGFEFHGPSAPIVTYVGFVRIARAIQPREVDEWRTAAAQIFTVAIAEHGNPDNRGTAPADVDCEFPVFYEHDNYRGRSYKLSASQPNLHRIYVQNRHMGNRVSSICVPRGWIATVYDYGDYKGASLRIVGPRDYEDLERQMGANGQRLNWGDRISSISVAKVNPLRGQADGGQTTPSKTFKPKLKLQRRSD